MKKSTKKGWVIVFAISLIVVICALGLLCWHLFGIYTSGKENNDGLTIDVPTVSKITSTEEIDDKPSSSVSSEIIVEDSEEEPSKAASKQDKKEKNTDSDKKHEDTEKDKEDERVYINGNINFTELWKINKDIYAWIKIPNTAVDYPILQTDGDDAFYLEHNIYKQYSFAGCIYSEKINSKDFSDPNTILYGHNLLNGTMFASLHNFRDPDFFDNNEYIYILMPEHTLIYRIFSAYEYDDRHIMYSFDFNNPDVFADYLEYATNPVNSMTYNVRETGVTANDTILTLSTCMDGTGASRYLVQGVLISDEPVG